MTDAPRSFVVFADDWGGHPSCVQHVFRRLALSHPTLWVNTVGLRPPRLDRRDAARVVRKVRTMLGGRARDNAGAAPREATPDAGLKLQVCAPPMVPWMRPEPVRALNRLAVHRALRRAAAHLGPGEPVLVAAVPNGVDALGALPFAAVVYYCVDDFANWPGVDASAAERLERELLAASDVVLATSEHLCQTRISPKGPTLPLPHGVDVEHFSRASDPVTTPLDGVRRGRPVLGYLGLVDERQDVALLVAVAEARPDWDLVFVGPTDKAPDPRLRRDNVRFVPAVPYARVPEALAGFDVAILPYVRGEVTRAINPLKLREYLASGRPIVATSLKEVARYHPRVRIADTPEDFQREVQAALEGPRDLRAEREALVREESWEARARAFLSATEDAVGRRR
ncbi:MAG: glycosyltransferase [Deltaproteobacteria bacterium]|nr:glycosyltransferase [Deltaproteobacteria bacterium]